MRRTLTLSVLLLLFVGGCSSDNEDLKKKIEELEEEISSKQNTIDVLKRKTHDLLIEKCTSSKEEVTNFGPYTLTEIVLYDTDWDCASDTGIKSGWFEEGVSSAIVKSPEKELYREYSDVMVSESEEFYNLSHRTGGAHCCVINNLLSKKAPYKIVFSATSDGDSGIYVGDYDDDGHPEISISDKVSLYWKGSYAVTVPITIFLEYSSDSFKLDKDLIYSYVTEEINNVEYDSIKFTPIAKESRREWSGWEDHYIPYKLIEITGALLFAGRESEAKRFLDYVWPEDLPNKDLYWKEFKEMIKGSKYWEN